MAIECFKRFIGINWNRVEPFLQQQSAFQKKVRYNHMFEHLQRGKHDTKYAYETSKDPKEWEYVERLLPFKTVPIPTLKKNYPSGWTPPKDEGLQLPYYVERSKNHMLSVYLNNYLNGSKITLVKRIQGDLWRLHNELKAHIEEQNGKRIVSSVNEGNNVIFFRGDYVYYIEQWLLRKGF